MARSDMLSPFERRENYDLGKVRGEQRDGRPPIPSESREIFLLVYRIKSALLEQL